MGKKNEVLSREEFGVSKGYAWENNMSANPFDLVHNDIWGPFNVSTPAGHRYFLTIVDDYTRAT